MNSRAEAPNDVIILDVRLLEITEYCVIPSCVKYQSLIKNIKVLVVALEIIEKHQLHNLLLAFYVQNNKSIKTRKIRC